MPNKAIFFDRDGTLNVDVDYLHEPADFVWVEGAIEAIRWANEHSYLVIVVTNQSGIARGYYDEAAVHRLHDWMNAELARQGAHIDAFYYCPHHPEGRVPAYTRVCDCRKPAPGMLLRAMAEHEIDPAASLMIGDAASDVAAAKQAGVRGVRYVGGSLADCVREALASAQQEEGEKAKMICNMLQKRKGIPVIRLHTWAFYLLCGFGLFSSVSTAVTSVFLSLLTALLLLRLWVKHDDWQDALPDGRLCPALLLLMGAVVLSSFFSGDILHSLRVFSHQYGTRAVGLFAVLLMIRQRQQLIWIAVCIGISLFINDVAVVFQGVVQGDYRAVGFSSYMTVGGILSMLLPALLLLSLSDHLDVRWRILAAGAFLLGCGALLYNGTRGAWLAVPVAMCLCTVVFVRQKKQFVIGALVALSVFAGIFMMSPSLSSRFVSIGDTHNQSNSERFLLWTSAYHMFVDHPLLGVGFAEFQTSYHREYVSPEAKEPWLAHAHSNVMHMLAECGGVGLLALLFFWYTFLSYGFRTWMATRHIVALLIPAILLGLILQGLTEYNMGNAAVMKLYWVLMGLCLQWLRLDRYAPA